MNPIYGAADSGMWAEQSQLDVLSNNLANVNTAGFQASESTFSDLLRQNIGPSATTTVAGAGVALDMSAPTFTQGPVQPTSNPLDVALVGPGFLAMQQADGTTVYTRAGNLHQDAVGYLAGPSGTRLSPSIKLDSNATAVHIAQDGTVSEQVSDPQNGSTTKIVGQIKIATFTNPQGLTHLGNNLFAPTAQSGPVTMLNPGAQGAASLVAGSVEGSNVDMASEMTDLTLTQRAFAANSRMAQLLDSMYSQAILLRPS